MTDELDTRYVVEAADGLAGRLPQARGGARRADVGGLGAAQRRGGVPPRPRRRPRERACRSSSSTRGPAARSRSSPCRCARGTARSARSSSPGPQGAFDASARRVLEILANQAAATISLIKDREQQRQLAVRDGLTGLYNRRAFNELLAAAIANEDRREAAASACVHPRHRPLQEAQRHLRPPRRRRGAALARAPPRPAPAQGRPGGALRRRGVRGDPAGLRPRAVACRPPSDCARPSPSTASSTTARASP